MRHLALLLVVAGVLAAAACNSASSPSGVASLTEPEDSPGGADAVVDDETALLDFAACMRGNGVEDFQDPYIGADGKVIFPDKATGSGDSSVGKDETATGKVATAFGEAFEVCRSLLDSTAFGEEKGGDVDVEKQDRLYELAVCMREEGFEMPDPDAVTGGLGDIDKQDPDFVAAYQECESVFTGGQSK